MTLYKHTCSCGNVWYSDFEDDECDNEDEHYVDVSTKLSHQDYFDAILQKAEDNGIVVEKEFLSSFFEVLENQIKDKKLLIKISRSLYEEVEWE